MAIHISIDPDFGHILNWSDAYQTGHPAIDQSHIYLLDLFRTSLENSSLPNTESYFSQAISELIGALQMHLITEEEIMHESKFDNFDLNKEEHRVHHYSFLNELKTYQYELEHGQILPSRTILIHLTKRFVDHVLFEARLLKVSKK